MQQETRNKMAGGMILAVLAAAFGLSYGGAQLSAKASVQEYTVSAVFNRVDGLYLGDEVRLGGMKIGVVDQMRLDDHFRAVLDLRIDSKIALPTDTSAAIHTDGLFGAKFIELEPGGEMEMLKADGQIVYTQDAVIVTELLDLIIAEGKDRREKQQGARE